MIVNLLPLWKRWREQKRDTQTRKNITQIATLSGLSEQEVKIAIIHALHEIGFEEGVKDFSKFLTT